MAGEAVESLLYSPHEDQIAVVVTKHRFCAVVVIRIFTADWEGSFGPHGPACR
jgi:hypothetical protein